MKYGLIAWIAYLINDAFIAAIGKSTDIQVLIGLLFSRGNDYGAPWVIAGLCFLWAVMERRLRYRKVEHLQGHNVELERIIDPHRTSSGLLPTGQTNPRDK